MKKGRRWVVVTIINVILLIFSLICFIGTAKNNDDINSMSALTYEEVGNGRVIVSLDGKEVAIGFGENSVRVAKSYKATSKKESIAIAKFIKEYASKNGYEVKRSITDLYGEYRLHNFLYWSYYKREKTADTDLEYGKDRRWYVEKASKVIGWCGL